METFSSDSVSFRTPSNINNTAPLRKRLMVLTCRMLPQKSSTTDFRPDFKCGSDRRCCECRVWVDCKCMEFLTADWCTKMWLRLDQTIRNLNSGDSGSPLAVMRLRVTKLKKSIVGSFICQTICLRKEGRKGGVMWNASRPLG